MNRRYLSDTVKLAIFIVAAVVITISVVATLLDVKNGPGYHAVFTNATGLESGDTVRIAGVEVGKVNGVSLVGDQAKVDFSVDASQHLTTTTTASIQFENLLGQRYLQIAAGVPGGAPLRQGATIPVARTHPGLDLTTIFSGFQPLLAALDPNQVNQLTASIIQILQGESGAVGNLVNETAALTGNLASRQNLINEVLDNLTPLLTTVNAHDTQLSNLITGLNSLVTGLANEHGTVGSAVTGLSQLVTNTNNLLQNVQPTLDQDLSGLQGVTGELVANQSQVLDQLGSVVHDLPALLFTLNKVSSSGNYLAVYVCDLTLNVSSPISVKLSPTVPQSPGLPVPVGLIGDPSQHTAVCS
ncbi:MAG TPA: MCE family protein [Acidimicrobiales bacterium]|nr:MCE family protein [Acidimicrobiales bacterium]